MIELSPERIAEAMRAEIAVRGEGRHPERAEIDTRRVQAGDLFFGLAGSTENGGRYARTALDAGAWGVVVDQEHAGALGDGPGGWVFVARNPLRAMQRLAREWRRAMQCKTIGITGSTGKTSTKDICRALMPGRVHASPENFNTEIGLPLTVLSAELGTDVLVCEMAMRGLGQIAELSQIAEPDIAAITNIGPVHLQLLGTLDAIAEAKAEIFEGLRERGVAVLPEDAEALEPHLNDSLRTMTFGSGGDVFPLSSRVEGESTIATIGTPDGEAEFRFPFDEAHNLANALCAVAVGVAAGAGVAEMAERAPSVRFSKLRGENLRIGNDILVINDCYNANPMSMRAALDHLAALEVPGRRVAVLGDMLELGPDAEAHHREVGAHARAAGVELLVGVGPLARGYAPDTHVGNAPAAGFALDKVLRPGDRVLVKGSRGIGLEAVAELLLARRGPAVAGEVDS